MTVFSQPDTYTSNPEAGVGNDKPHPSQAHRQAGTGGETNVET